MRNEERTKIKVISVVASMVCMITMLVANFNTKINICEAEKYILAKTIEVTNTEKPTEAEYAVTKPKLAIVIDDFGEDRQGVEKMLSLPIKFTGAVMPGMDYSNEDAESLHKAGKEVMLHMPMEAYGNLPQYWYGPIMIRNTHSTSEARNILTQAIQSTPYVKGVNIHMGTAVSQNETLMREIMTVMKERDLPFLDSKTIEGSVCPQIAVEKGIKFCERDVFLEVASRPNYQLTTARLYEAIEVAKTKGKAVVIGHVGPVGHEITASVLQDNIEEIEQSGVELVFFSELF